MLRGAVGLTLIMAVSKVEVTIAKANATMGEPPKGSRCQLFPARTRRTLGAPQGAI